MSDPIEDLLDASESGKSIIKNRKILHFDYVPDVILHRKSEQEQVTQSLLPILKQSRPSNLLIYGKPGTGKTLVVGRVLSKIRERVKRSNFPIKLISANAKLDTTVSGLLVTLGRKLGMEKDELPTTGLGIGEVFKRILEKIQTNELNVVFVIDEIDNLAKLDLKTGYDILYQLTRANEQLKDSTMTLVGISNDLRFKESLDPRVVSSFGDEEIVFMNYNAEQIKEILQERIKEAFMENSVEEPALNLCAALAGGEHGDARRAIDLIRIAGEIAERQQSDKVTNDHVRKAALKMEENKEESTLRAFPLHEKLVMIAIMKANGSSIGDIYTSYKSLCKIIGKDEITQRRIAQMLSEIELSGIISGRMIYQGSHGRAKKYKLTISSEMIKKTFKDDLSLQDVV